jgi:hypothetical protein
MKLRRKPSALTMALGVFGVMGIGGVAMAGEACDPTKEKCDPPPCDPKKEQCFPICHNIGGPQELGANCDGATGACTFTLEDGTTTVVPLNHFLGIIIGASANSVEAHLKHGDGFVEVEYNPALHLASTGQNHKASNVECLAARATTTQPPEPGN